ncbi:aminocarboxymuconate-semialdehyde decarboxylase [Synchytrium microbalum]|uniref:2-amino-3-carboxymuconate-6-semialdehyde decarboxylase n=1 Tax=Synchytrium microbalum TaxID=1806994 RepID=A0A507C634_9FUNG|nr:aminocarboxymuconate-semialdehyde decarboxylase [Synchytrium microbalum]TPX34569.1 aminocarboxymuconate-semialdehyde decarboxylase [Synchytrium microbalum]
MFSYWAKPADANDLAKYLNDNIAFTCAQNPKRFIGLATIPMQAPQLAIEELQRCVNELGFKGIQIGSHVNDWNLDAEELEPIWTACEELDVAVFIHPWDMDGSKRNSKYWFPWLIGMPCETTMAISSLIFGGVLERHPKLRVCLSHGGGSFPYTMGRIEHGWRVRPDLFPTKIQNPLSYIPRIYCDSLVHDADALEFLVKKFGAKRLMLGSDYPFPLGEHEPGQLVESVTFLSREDKASILGLNALEFLGLDVADYMPTKIATTHPLALIKDLKEKLLIKENDLKDNLYIKDEQGANAVA